LGRTNSDFCRTSRVHEVRAVFRSRVEFVLIAAADSVGRIEVDVVSVPTASVGAAAAFVGRRMTAV